MRIGVFTLKSQATVEAPQSVCVRVERAIVAVRGKPVQLLPLRAVHVVRSLLGLLSQWVSR